jgi:hypothetical protein
VKENSPSTTKYAVASTKTEIFQVRFMIAPLTQSTGAINLVRFWGTHALLMEHGNA